MFQSNQFISYVEINRKFGQPKFDIVADSAQLIPTSTFGENSNAIAAINGNFFDVKNGGSVSFVKDENKVVNTTRLYGDKRAFHQKAAVIIKNNGKIKIKEWNGEADWEDDLKWKNIFLNGPMLINNGKPSPLNDSAFTNNRHPRSCLCITKNNNVLFLVADGRNANAAGLNLNELTKVLQWLNCKQAINFDGGGSSTLWVEQFGVVNHPSDNKQWDNMGERKVANVLIVK